jgi:hypothetical protein
MKISELQLTGEKQLVATDTDAMRVISTEWDIEQYIRTFGDVEIVKDTTHVAFTNHWGVPSLKAKADAYTEAKARDCQRWGSE